MTSSMADSEAPLRADRAIEQSPWKRQMRRALKDPLTVVGGLIVVAWLAFAVAAPLVTRYGPDDPDMTVRLQGPGATHLFGTDQYGRDILTRVIYGARISMRVGLISVGISLLVGLPLGAIAGYFGGRTEQAIMRAMDMILAFPSLVLAMAIATALGRGLTSALIAVGVVGIPDFARLMHGQTISLRRREFVVAARAIGAGHLRIIFRGIVPNAISPVVVRATLGLGFAVLTAASLSFLGLGVQPPDAEWGAMVSEGRDYIISGQWWLTTMPGLAIMSAVLGFNLLGDGLRDLLDPHEYRM